MNLDRADAYLNEIMLCIEAVSDAFQIHERRHIGLVISPR